MAYETRNRALIVTSLVVALLVGIVLGFLLDKPDDGNRAAEPSESATGPGGEDPEEARTEEGAVEAARAFALVSTTDVIRDEAEFIAAMESLSAPEWEADARRQAIEGHGFLVDRYGDDVDVSGAVIRYKVLDFSDTQAQVKLWLVSIASGSSRPSVDEVWGTAVVDLEWIDDAWLVSDAENSTGPAPVDLPTSTPRESAKALMEELSEFEWAP